MSVAISKNADPELGDVLIAKHNFAMEFLFFTSSGSRWKPVIQVLSVNKGDIFLCIAHERMDQLCSGLEGTFKDICLKFIRNDQKHSREECIILSDSLSRCMQLGHFLHVA